MKCTYYSTSKKKKRTEQGHKEILTLCKWMVNFIAFLHVNPRCFIRINLLLTHLSAEQLQHAKKNYWIQSSYGDKASPRVKWDLGGNVSRTHLGDRSTVEWPLNSKTALFIWGLIDGAVIFISQPSLSNKQIFACFLTLFFSLSHKHTCSINMEQKKPLQTAINNNGVIKLRAIFFSFFCNSTIILP